MKSSQNVIAMKSPFRSRETTVAVFLRIGWRMGLERPIRYGKTAVRQKKNAPYGAFGGRSSEFGEAALPEACGWL